MDGFDLVIRLFALLLGFSLTEVLGGFARTLRLKLGLTPVAAGAVRVGWLVPLLGLLVVMEQVSFWMSFYILQAHIPASFLAMLVVLVFVGGFYVVSTLIFPSDPARWPDFDAHYFRVKPAVLSAVIGFNLALVCVGALVVVGGGDTLTPIEAPTPVAVAAMLLQLPMLVALVVSRRPGVSLVLLVLSNAALIVRAASML